MEKELEHRTGTGSHLSLRSRERMRAVTGEAGGERNLSTGTGTGSHLSLRSRERMRAVTERQVERGT